MRLLVRILQSLRDKVEESAADLCFPQADTVVCNRIILELQLTRCHSTSLTFTELTLADHMIVLPIVHPQAEKWKCHDLSHRARTSVTGSIGAEKFCFTALIDKIVKFHALDNLCEGEVWVEDHFVVTVLELETRTLDAVMVVKHKEVV